MSVDRRGLDAVKSNPGPIYKTADYSMTPADEIVEVTPNGTANVTITLPNIYESKGRSYTIYSNAAAAYDVVVAGDGSERTAFSVTLYAADDVVVVMSDGVYWHTLQLVQSDITPVAKTADYTMTLSDKFLQVTPPAASTITMTLPAVAKAAGKVYTVWSDGNDTGTITVVDAGDAEIAVSEVLTADNDRLTVISDGRFWHQITNVTT